MNTNAKEKADDEEEEEVEEEEEEEGGGEGGGNGGRKRSSRTNQMKIKSNLLIWTPLSQTHRCSHEIHCN